MFRVSTEEIDPWTEAVHRTKHIVRILVEDSTASTRLIGRRMSPKDVAKPDSGVTTVTVGSYEKEFVDILHRLFYFAAKARRRGISFFFFLAVIKQIRQTCMVADPTFESFNDWEGGGMSQICPCFERGRHEIVPPGALFDEPPGEMS